MRVQFQSAQKNTSALARNIQVLCPRLTRTVGPTKKASWTAPSVTRFAQCPSLITEKALIMRSQIIIARRKWKFSDPSHWGLQVTVCRGPTEALISGLLVLTKNLTEGGSRLGHQHLPRSLSSAAIAKIRNHQRNETDHILYIILKWIEGEFFALNLFGSVLSLIFSNYEQDCATEFICTVRTQVQSWVHAHSTTARAVSECIYTVPGGQKSVSIVQSSYASIANFRERVNLRPIVIWLYKNIAGE